MNSLVFKLDSLKKSHVQLQKAIHEATSELERAGAIQRFENCYELAWKTLREALAYLGNPDLHSPRIIFRQAAVIGLIKDPEQWFMFIDSRNETIQTYDNLILNKIFGMLPSFSQEVSTFIHKIDSLQITPL